MDLAISNLENEIITNRQTSQIFSLDYIFNVLENILSAIKYLKTNDISHQNIKPSNILVFE